MARRRGRRGAGSIVPRDGGYQAQWSGGLDGNGKRIRQSKTFVLRNDAEWWLRQAARSGRPPVDETVAEYLDRWLDAVAVTIEASTLRSYADHVENHITPMLGRIRVTNLTTSDVNRLIADRLRHVSPKTHKPLSPTTVRLIMATLRTAIAAGVDAHELPDNVVTGAQMPRATEQRRDSATGWSDRRYPTPCRGSSLLQASTG